MDPDIIETRRRKAARKALRKPLADLLDTLAEHERYPNTMLLAAEVLAEALYRFEQHEQMKAAKRDRVEAIMKQG